MWKLYIEQQNYNKVEFEFKSVNEAAEMVSLLSPHAKDGTLFTIKQEEENKDGETGV